MASALFSQLREKIFASDQPQVYKGRAVQTSKAAGPLKVDAKQLISTLAQHRKWLETKGEHGTRAVLKGAIISTGRGRIANVNLRQADLRGTTLRGMRMENVILAGAELRDADLRGAQLAQAKGLTAEQLAGANLSGASLPASAQTFAALEWVPAAARAARTALILTVVACLYALLTAAATTDASLFLNGPSSRLPIVQAPIYMPIFYWAAPVVVFLLFVTLHLYLLRLWGRLARLPAVFPDGGAIDTHLPPWLFHGMPQAYLSQLRELRPRLFPLQFGVTLILGWLLAPLTLFVLWQRYLVRHEAAGSLLHVALLVLAVALALYTYALMGAILRGEVTGHERLALARHFKPPYMIVTGLCLFGFLLYSVKAEGGFGLAPLHAPDFSYMELVGADLRGNDLSGADLSNANLTSADLRGTVLRGVDLSNSLLTRALLSQAVLDDAKLLNAKLDGADLRGASLQRAQMDGSVLSGATLSEANLARAQVRKADLRKASLDSALMVGADFTGSDLSGANISFTRAEESRFTDALLERSDLRTINLTAADLTRTHLSHANLENAMLMQISGVQTEFGSAVLKGADLKFSNLHGADLRRANLTGADLRGADFKDATFAKADLSGANLIDSNFDCVKLAFVTSDPKTRLPKRCARSRVQ